MRPAWLVGGSQLASREPRDRRGGLCRTQPTLISGCYYQRSPKVADAEAGGTATLQQPFGNRGICGGGRCLSTFVLSRARDAAAAGLRADQSSPVIDVVAQRFARRRGADPGIEVRIADDGGCSPRPARDEECWKAN
jgi:hypothetical protein